MAIRSKVPFEDKKACKTTSVIIGFVILSTSSCIKSVAIEWLPRTYWNTFSFILNQDKIMSITPREVNQGQNETAEQNPRGVLGYKRDRGGGGGPTEPDILHPKKYMDVILCTQKNTRLEILESLHADYSNHVFGSCGNFGLNCVRTISLAEIRTQKNSRRFFRPKKIHG